MDTLKKYIDKGVYKKVIISNVIANDVRNPKACLVFSFIIFPSVDQKFKT